MARQNPKTIRKNREVKGKGVNKKLRSVKMPPKKVTTDKPAADKPVTPPAKAVTPKPKRKPLKNVDLGDYVITSYGQKVKMMNDISTVDGTLYKNEVVKIESSSGIAGKDLRVVDTLGRVWYVSYSDISTKV